MNRERGVTVYPLLESAYSQGSNRDDKYVLGVNPHTEETYLIHTPEGVGYEVTHQKPWRFTDYDLEAKWYTLLEVRAMANYKDPIDLVDAIRTFGARLENNFWINHRALTSEVPLQETYMPEAAEAMRRMDKEAEDNGTV